MAYDTSDNVTMDTLALIFRSGQVDQYGRVWPLAVYGDTADNRSVVVQRNVYPSLTSVRATLAQAESWGMTRLTVSVDGCG